MEEPREEKQFQGGVFRAWNGKLVQRTDRTNDLCVSGGSCGSKTELTMAHGYWSQCLPI